MSIDILKGLEYSKRLPWGKKPTLGQPANAQVANIFFTYDNWHSVQAKAWLISNNTMICINQLPDWTLFVWYIFQINILTSFRIVLQNTPKLQIYIIADKHISSNIDNIHHRPWYISRKYFSVNISYLPRGCRLGAFLRWWPPSTMFYHVDESHWWVTFSVIWSWQCPIYFGDRSSSLF